MKKHILLYTVVYLTIGLVISCSEDFLDKSPYGITTDDNFYKTEEQVWQSLIVSYTNMSTDWFGASWVFGTLCADDGHKGGQNESDQQQMQDCAYFRATSTNSALSSVWTNAYRGIRNSNMVIANAPNPTYTNPDNKNRYIGEAKFCRAHNYLFLVRIFGDIPILSTPVDPDDEIIIPRSPASDVYAFIKSDLQEAAANIPSVTEFDMTTEWGRASSESALAMLARAALYFHDYETALDAAKAVIDVGYYELEPEFQDYFTRLDGPSKEAVWETLNQDTDGNGNGTIISIMQRSYSAGGWQFDCPTGSLRDEFEVGDPRRLFTIMEDGDKFPRPDGSIEVIENSGGLNLERMNNRKTFETAATRSSRWMGSSLNIPIIRYSDVLLMYAEALLETDGDPQEVCDYINLVRTRANNSRKYDIQAYGNTPAEKKANRTYQVAEVSIPLITTTDDLTAAIRHERRVEFGMENLRFYDLKRWGYEYAKPFIVAARGAYGPIDQNLTSDRFNAYPIPQTEMDRTQGEWEQNLGW